MPIIVTKKDNKYELQEGWHRTVESFRAHPDGYSQLAYVANDDDDEPFEELHEAASTPCIVVDVQPSYTSGTDLAVDDLMHFLNGQDRILMLVNAEADGLTEDTVDDIRYYWEENGFDPNNWPRVKIIDKGYGYLRGWMDEGISPSIIIMTIRQMYRSHVYDSRDLPPAIQQQLINDTDITADLMEYDPLIVDWISVALLKQYSNGYIMGGARTECLAEVQLMMSAFNIRATEIREFIYEG
jgi:hypothetical protein